MQNILQREKEALALYRASKYGKNFEGYKKFVRDNLVIIVQIEDIEAVDNLDDILKVKGIDGTLIGPYDLSGSIGVPGKFDNLKVKQAIQKKY